MFQTCTSLSFLIRYPYPPSPSINNHVASTSVTSIPIYPTSYCRTRIAGRYESTSFDFGHFLPPLSVYYLRSGTTHAQLHRRRATSLSPSTLTSTSPHILSSLYFIIDQTRQPNTAWVSTRRHSPCSYYPRWCWRYCPPRWDLISVSKPRL